MTDRIKRMYQRLQDVKTYNITAEKATIAVESFKQNEGWPTILKYSMAERDYVEKRTIFIQPDELLVGNMAATPYGLELNANIAAWPEDDMEAMLKDSKGLLAISDEDKKKMRALDDYWVGKGRNVWEYRGLLIDDEKLFPFMRRGFLQPPYTNKFEGRGQGACGGGVAMQFAPALLLPDYELFLGKGFEQGIAEAKEELSNVPYMEFGDEKKAIFLQAAIISMQAVIRMAERYAELADKMAAEEKDPVRADELREIAAVCRQVPAKPARTFREALQAMSFYWLFLATNVLGLGRMDQYLYPYYKADIEAGRITRDEALELIECFRLKIMEFNQFTGGAFQRQKLSGMARWNNIILGGIDKTGNEATNELTYIFLDAALEVRTPHPTMTVRVSEKTPDKLMKKALEVVRTGCGYPAFISEKEYMDYLMSRGVSWEEATDAAIAGCIDINLPGRSRPTSIGFFNLPLVLNLALNNGRDSRDHFLYGVETGKFEDCKSFDEFYDMFFQQLKKTIKLYVQAGFNTLMGSIEKNPCALMSIFFVDAFKVGRDIREREVPYENGGIFNVVGIANTIDSLAAIKKLCFDDKVITPAQLNEALNANWEGHEDIHRMCLSCPKYGNNDDYVDSIGEKFWIDLGELAMTFKSPHGAPLVCSAISISSHAPAGSLTPATPDGRYDGETMADASVSPVQGVDKNGPLAVMQSAMRMSKGWSVNLFNMKLSPSTLKTDEDLMKLASMIKVYMTHGGKQIQFNVVDTETLKKAKVERDNYRNLLVRVAGYSAYFVNLTERVQDEIINRTEHTL